ncbi:MAG: nucleotidyltransferase domain-containing protein, partial [Rhodocyclaceae bacterium]|nr:nucleotidyltransferase domain-containing protein [Rhodocyclaceae bacterium]
RALVDLFERTRRDKPLAPQARMAMAAGCTPVAPKHFRVIKRLAEYGFFRAGGVLIGTHAFLALGNMLGVLWRDGATTLDMDFAHAGRNVAVALPADLRIDIHGALESLEMGLLPLAQFNGKVGAQYRNPQDPELRLDFVTRMTRTGKPVAMPNLNVVLQPLKFMEFSLEGTTQACIFAAQGACVVNLPMPERFAVHKLIVYGERPQRERAKANKDLLQAASLVAWFHDNDQVAAFNGAWRDALGRGGGWRERAEQGRKALLKLAPELADEALWTAEV